MNIFNLLAISLVVAGISIQGFAYTSDWKKSVLESQKTCGNFVRFDDQNLYLGYGPYLQGFEKIREPMPGKLQIVSLKDNTSVNVTAKDSVIDLVSVDQTLYVLTYSGIEEWDLQTKTRLAVYPTYMANRVLEYKEHAESMARYNNWLVIAHGRLGISIFDIQKKRIINQFKLLSRQFPWESMATSVTISGDTAWVLMDNFTLVKPDQGNVFKGLVQIHLPSQSVQREIPGVDPGADAIINDGKSWIISYMGLPLWKFEKDELKNKQLQVQPQHQYWSFPVKGHPTGLPEMDENYYYTCYLTPPKDRTQGGKYQKIPVALNRKQLML